MRPPRFCVWQIRSLILSTNGGALQFGDNIVCSLTLDNAIAELMQAAQWYWLKKL